MNGVTDPMDMNVSKLRETVNDRETGAREVCGAGKSCI